MGIGTGKVLKTTEDGGWEWHSSIDEKGCLIYLRGRCCYSASAVSALPWLGFQDKSWGSIILLIPGLPLLLLAVHYYGWALAPHGFPCCGKYSQEEKGSTMLLVPTLQIHSPEIPLLEQRLVLGQILVLHHSWCLGWVPHLPCLNYPYLLGKYESVGLGTGK